MDTTNYKLEQRQLQEQQQQEQKLEAEADAVAGAAAACPCTVLKYSHIANSIERRTWPARGRRRGRSKGRGQSGQAGHGDMLQLSQGSVACVVLLVVCVGIKWC